MKGDRLCAEQLQALLQHKSFAKTETYIKMARDLNPALPTLFVPELPETQPAERKAKRKTADGRPKDVLEGLWRVSVWNR
jgi:hypothetical protein